MNSLNFARSKHSPLNKRRQEGIFNKTLIPNHSPFERRRKLGEIVKNPPTPFIKGEIYSFSSPLTGERTKGGGFKKKFHSIPSPLGRGLGGGFTLVELIVVVTILAILGTIAFISLQGYSQDARDSKRISDTRSLISKITIENTKGISYSEIMNEEGIKENTLMINGKSQTGTQNVREPINRDILKENRENFVDPTNNHPYPFAYAIGNSNGQLYNFMQLAYVSEKIGLTKLAGNYYKMNEVDDSPSLFVGCITNPDEEIEENGCPIYDVGVGYIPPASCEPQQVTVNGRIYDIIESRNHRGEITLTITGTLLLNSYTEYTQIFKCNDGTFEKKKGTEESSKLVCVNGYSGGSCEIPESCNAIFASNSLLSSGEYEIYPNGETLQVYCDMTATDGGRTLALRAKHGSSSPNHYFMTTKWGEIPRTNVNGSILNLLSFNKMKVIVKNSSYSVTGIGNFTQDDIKSTANKKDGTIGYSGTGDELGFYIGEGLIWTNNSSNQIEAITVTDTSNYWMVVGYLNSNYASRIQAPRICQRNTQCGGDTSGEILIWVKGY